MSWRLSLPLRFAHCDPAGIAFFPRLLELVDAVVEDWTHATLGIDRRVLHHEMGLGLPTVRLESDFIAMARLGEMLDFNLDVTRLGRTSVHLEVMAAAAGRPRFRSRLVQVLVDQASGSPCPWPAAWRSAIQHQHKLCEAAIG